MFNKKQNITNIQKNVSDKNNYQLLDSYKDSNTKDFDISRRGVG